MYRTKQCNTSYVVSYPLNLGGITDVHPGPEAVVNWLVDNPNIQIPAEASDVESGSSYDNCSDSDLNPDDDFEDLEADYEQVWSPQLYFPSLLVYLFIYCSGVLLL